MHKICDRALKEFNRINRACGFFDDSLTHGGPEGSDRKRRDVDFGDLRYSDLNAVDSINGITAGMRNWSKRYLNDCGGQKNHAHIVGHAAKWRAKLTAKYNDGC